MKRFSQLRHIAAALAVSAAAFERTRPSPPRQERRAVHGYFADGSGWQAVSNILTREFRRSATGNVVRRRREGNPACRRRAGRPEHPRRHSYGGAVITEAGTTTRSRAHVAAFQPDTGESPLDLTKKTPPATKAIKATEDGHLYFDEASFHADFAADVPAAEAKFMAISQVTPAAQSFGVPITHAAWRTKPSSGRHGRPRDQPRVERFMTQRAGSKTIELSSHVAYESKLEQAPSHSRVTYVDTLPPKPVMHSRDRFASPRSAPSSKALIAQPERYVEFAALSRVGVAAIGAIQHEIAHKFPEIETDTTARQFCGAMVAEVMRRHGHDVVQARGRLGGTLFSYGAVFSAYPQLLPFTDVVAALARSIGSPRMRRTSGRAVDTPPRRHGLLARRACVPPARSRRGVRRAHRRRRTLDLP